MAKDGQDYIKVIDDYINGDVKIKGESQDVMTAMDTFFHVGKMAMDNVWDRCTPSI